MTESELKRAINTKRQLDNLEIFVKILENSENVGLSILLGDKEQPISSCRLFCERTIKRIKNILKDELSLTKYEFEKM